jgi:glycosyltransferase involved in cell wall biosynthesis
LPVVSTNAGGVPSSVSDGEDGLLVPPRDPKALAAALSEVMENGELRRALIRRGRERVRDWTVERFVATVLDALGMHAD